MESKLLFLLILWGLLLVPIGPFCLTAQPCETQGLHDTIMTLLYSRLSPYMASGLMILLKLGTLISCVSPQTLFFSEF